MEKKTRRELDGEQKAILTNARNVVRVLAMMQNMDESSLAQVQTAVNRKINALRIAAPMPEEEK